jgi:hypothetical protein
MIEFGTPKQKMISWMKSIACLELILARGFASTHLVNLSTVMSWWIKPPGCLFEGPQKIQTPYHKWPNHGDHLELRGQGMDLSGEVLPPSARSYYFWCIVGHGRLVKVMPESLSNHAS